MKNEVTSDDEKYECWQREQEAQWEALCKRCGACCGMCDGDPCEHLMKDGAGTYQCAVYENRFGIHATVGGKTTRCVPIQTILYTDWPGVRQCAYTRTT